MVITVRLEPDLLKKIEAYSKARFMSRSEIIKESLRRFFEDKTHRPTPYELGKDLFGRGGSGKSDLGVHHEKYLKEWIHAKHKRSR